MPTNLLLKRLATIYAGEAIRYPHLRAVTLAQWMLESGRATSNLAKLHYNFGGLKWRPEMGLFATRITYEAHDGTEAYCKFAPVYPLDACSPQTVRLAPLQTGPSKTDAKARTMFDKVSSPA